MPTASSPDSSPTPQGGDGGRTPIPDPTELTSRAVNALRTELTAIFDEKLKGVVALLGEQIKNLHEELQRERDLRIEQKADRKVELDSALKAAQDLTTQQGVNFTDNTTKTEDRFEKAITAQADTFNTYNVGQTREMNDIKDRLTRIEAARIGGQEATTEHRAASNYTMAVISFVVGLIVLGIPLLIILANKP